MRFAPPLLAPNMVREWYLVATATVSPLTGAALASWNGAQTSLPAHFALAQNQPNPFGGSTTIRFELPVGTRVRLEVFDAQGRRLRELANRYFAVGYQSVTWDGTDDLGRQAGPGVYFYRMEAAAFRDRKKMVLLP